MLERFVLKKRQEIIPKPIRAVFIFFIVTIGWVLFFSPSMGSAVHYYGQLFGRGHMGFMDSTARYYFSHYAPLLIVGFIGCTPLPKHVHALFAFRENRAFTAVSAGCYILLFLLCVAYLVTSTYSSFLYFQF